VAVHLLRRLMVLIHRLVVSFAAAAGCELEYPAGFDRVTRYLDWIERDPDIQIPSYTL